jgi:hypothetical protein
MLYTASYTNKLARKEDLMHIYTVHSALTECIISYAIPLAAPDTDGAPEVRIFILLEQNV